MEILGRDTQSLDLGHGQPLTPRTLEI